MTRIGTNYAQALYSLAAQEGLTHEIAQQLRALDAAFREEPGFVRLLSAPNIGKQERCRILDESFGGKAHPYVVNFLKLLTERGYIRYFGDCCKAFARQYHEDNGILPVRAVTAVALTEKQLSGLTEKLTALTGKKILLTNRVEPSCLGGVRLDFDGRQIDGTVKRRLESVGAMLRNTVL